MKKFIYYFILFLVAFIVSDLVYHYIEFGSLQPVLLSSPRENVEAKISNKVKLLSEQRNIDFSLFEHDPKPRNYAIVRNEKVDSASVDFQGHMIDDIIKQWNANFYNEVFHQNIDAYRRVVFDGYSNSCQIFNGYDSSAHPFYRYTPNSSIDGYQIKFNDFGWGGSDIKFKKPEKTIRLAFVGGSTTQQVPNYDFAYPDYIEEWLDRWSKRKKLDIDFEVINVGRVAQQSMDFKAIVKYELLPVEPDLVVYYEGRNQFDMKNLVGFNHYNARYRPLLYFLIGESIWLQKIGQLLNLNLLNYIEKSKPALEVLLPKEIDEQNPNIKHQKLPVNLSQILSDIDCIRVELDSIDSELVLSSFAMVTDDKILDSEMEFASIYSYWIHDFGKVPLHEIRRFNELENRIFKSYANSNELSYFDASGDIAHLPEAFMDGIHLSQEGIKLHAWSVFTQLLPLLEKKINTRELPRETSQIDTVHPYIKNDGYLQVIEK